MNNTEKTPKRSSGKGAMNGTITGRSFTKDNQPKPEVKKSGWEKRRRARELVQAILDQPISGRKGTDLKQKAAEYFSIPAEKVTVEVVMIFKQVEKAINESDTSSFNAIMDRAFGKPKESIVFQEEEPITVGYGKEYPV